jgi:branched-subunit amino acid transport protein
MGDAAIWSAVLVGAAGTFLWRALGVAVASRVDQDSALFQWIGCVAYAMAAGLMARVLLMPGGDTDPAGIGARLAAFTVAVAVWAWRGKSVPAGLVAGVAAYAVLVLAFGGAGGEISTGSG